MLWRALGALLLAWQLTSVANAQEDLVEEDENPSNPLAKTRNTDLRVQHYDLGRNLDRSVFAVEGATMLTARLKFRYEANLWSTNVTGDREQGMETVRLKAIYFARDRQWGSWGIRPAVGLEWIYDFDNTDKGIGAGSNILSPFVGLAFAHRSGLSLIPLVQHYAEYSGTETNTTAFRLIGLKPLNHGYWIKLDAKIPVDWENDNAVPASAEFQLGRMIRPGLGVYADGFVGLGSDRPYDWGLGIGVRFLY